MVAGGRDIAVSRWKDRTPLTRRPETALPPSGDVKILEEIIPDQLDGTANGFTQPPQTFVNLPTLH